MTCETAMFERYCRFFKSHFHPAHLPEIVDKMEKGSRLGGELAVCFDDGYRDNFELAAPVLERMGIPAAFFVVTGFVDTDQTAWWDRRLPVRPAWMTWTQVRSLHSRGFEIGSHSLTHRNLGEIDDRAAREEIEGSRQELSKRLSAEVDLFAYPYGGPADITRETREIVRAAGYRCCCSLTGGINRTGADPFHILRIPFSTWFVSPYHLGFDILIRRA
jgi:peptidoglycan/xylan/chitin deacetylase (PgdA/CDA1 family)